MKKISLSHPLVQCGLLWCVLVGLVLWLRPLLVTIETRAMTVAWEMLVRHDFLVPSLNFKPYTQKPPLLAWMINLGWAVFGVHRWMGTVLVSAFSFGCVAWAYHMARRFWPNEPQRAALTVWLCFGAVIMQSYGTVIFYDFILAFFVLAALYHIWQAATLQRLSSWFYIAVFIGLGALTKGPVMLVHTVPILLSAPFWSPVKIRPVRWYGLVLLVLLAGGAIALAWAIPAALDGGADYAKWILKQQTTQRVVKAFDHEQPWYYYLMVAPVLALPWLFIPSVWRHIPRLKNALSTAPTRFLLCWIVPVFVIFSAISGKQLQYMLPLWCAFALGLSGLFATGTTRKADRLMATLPFVTLGLVWIIVIALSACGHPLRLPPIVTEILFSYRILPFIYMAGIIAIFTFGSKRNLLVQPVAIAMWWTLCVVHAAGAPQAFDRFSADPVAKIIRDHPGRELAIISARYQGDVNFLARLTRSVTILPLEDQQALDGFWAAHPDGIVFLQVRDEAALAGYHILLSQPARTKRINAVIEKAPQ